MTGRQIDADVEKIKYFMLKKKLYCARYGSGRK